MAYQGNERVRVPVRGGGDVVVADLTRLRLARPYIAMTPQWDFLNVLAAAGEAEPTFSLRMGTECLELLRSGGRVVGVRCRGRDGEEELRADLVIGCDGRTSGVRADALLPLTELPVRFDAWWFRLPTEVNVGSSLLPRTGPGSVFVMIPRRGYVQAARLIPKGSDAELRAAGDHLVDDVLPQLGLLDRHVEACVAVIAFPQRRVVPGELEGIAPFELERHRLERERGCRDQQRQQQACTNPQH